MQSSAAIPIELHPDLAAGGWSQIYQQEPLTLLFRMNGLANKVVVVTFDALSAYSHRLQKVTAENVVTQCHADHLHISYTEHRWYQTSVLERTLAEARKLTSRYAEVVCLGHSMGGYAALMFSRALGATRVIAFAPQISPDVEKVPFETRFASYMAGGDYVFDDMGNGMAAGAKKYIVFDPYFSTDRQHFDLIAQFENVIAVKLPFTGHHPGLFLKECGLLGVITRALIDKSYDVGRFRPMIRAARRYSSTYMLCAAMTASFRGRFRLALSLVNIGYTLSPQNKSVIDVYKVILESDPLMAGLVHMLVRLLVHENAPDLVYESAERFAWSQLTTRVDRRLGPNQ